MSSLAVAGLFAVSIVACGSESASESDSGTIVVCLPNGALDSDIARLTDAVMVERENQRGRDLMDGVSSILVDRPTKRLVVELDGTADAELVVQRLADAAAEGATVHLGRSPSC